MQSRALTELESHFEKAVADAILLITKEHPTHPIQEEEHMSVSISLNDKTWSVHSYRRLNLFTWSEFDRLYELEGVRNLTRMLIDEHYLDLILKLRSRGVPDTTENYDPANDAKFIFKQFLVTYAYVNGIDFDRNAFQRLFSEWQLYITEKDRGKHLIVLNNFELSDLNEVVFGNYLIRRLTGEEVMSLLLVDGYNRESIGNHFGNFRAGLIGKYSPEYCIEFKEEVPRDSNLGYLESYYEDEFRKLMVFTLLRVFKDTDLSVGTELFTSSEFVKHTAEFNSAATSLRSILYQVGPKYQLNKSELNDFLSFSEQFFKVNYRNWGAFRVASRRLEYSQGRTEIEDKIIDLIVAIEAVLGAGNKQEITYKISLRSAHFIGETPDDRTEIFEIISLAYDVRSKIVHGADDPMATKKSIQKRYKIANIYVLHDRLAGYVKRIMRKLIRKLAETERILGTYSGTHRSLIQQLDDKIITNQ